MFKLIKWTILRKNKVHLKKRAATLLKTDGRGPCLPWCNIVFCVTTLCPGSSLSNFMFQDAQNILIGKTSGLQVGQLSYQTLLLYFEAMLL